MVTPKDSKTQIVEWATGQSFNNILLLGILVCIGWLGWYVITIGLPEQHNRYEAFEQRHREEREKIIEVYDRWHGKTHKTHDGEIKVGQQ